MILDIFLSAITSGSRGFIAAAEAVSCCLSPPLINGVRTLERGLDAAEQRTVHRWSEINDEGASSIENNMGLFPIAGDVIAHWFSPESNLSVFFFPSYRFEALALIWLWKSA